LKELAQQYFLALSLTHEVIAQPTDDGTIKYQGPSPDEIALV
jgi:magnesium-transporting ATPase (P-type)